MKTTIIMLVWIIVFILTFMLGAFLASLVSSYSYTWYIQCPTYWFITTFIGWIPATIVCCDLDDMLK